jgi:hypothetical protein
MKQTSHPGDTEALRTEKKGPFFSMEAGISGHVWSIEEVAGLLDSQGERAA